ncbi:two-component system sensor histidine kinase YesM [Paenibacillus phyllosphaerae]|uniref:histidine kinase n=1 Tax=Paenibacillus phyllosphaerae TaxID=274593 RepID=A0A7W5B057_9BACL|nr:sensor histidine kinase [Paenibacillus phyllosphaerae]MBB3111481.1 two-component system sensor histidine kinase YesM [Paenibacillus phyllosphaerae]
MSWSKARYSFMQTVFLRNHSLGTRLLVFSAVLVIIPMLIVGIISYQRSSSVLQNEAREYSWQIIEQVKSHVEHYVRDIEIISLKIINNPDMGKFLKMNSLEEVEQSQIRQPIMQLLRDSAYSRSDISNISVFLSDVLILDLRGDDSIEPLAPLMDEYWYQLAPASGEPMLVSREIKWRDSTEPVISIVKRLVSPQTLTPIGMLIIDINYKRFQEIADLVTIGKTGYMFILDSQGHYVYHPQLTKLGQSAQFDGLDDIEAMESGSILTSSHGSKFLTFSHSSFLGWTLVTAVPYRELTDGIGYIGRTILWSIAITLGVAYCLGIGLASSIIKPVRQLQRLMKRVETGDFTSKAVVTSRDELGLLTHGFNKMVQNLNELLEQIYFSKLKETEMTLQQKEMELKMLLAQINPHFLYNSLETIRGMALEQGMDDISNMASSLARLLRYNLRNPSPCVTLREELDICEMYLRIMKYRFEDRLVYSFSIPEQFRDERIAKFTLQPIVENCVVHGSESGSGMSRIHIAAHSDAEGFWRLVVEDTGSGIPPEKLMSIQNSLLHEDAVHTGSHIGLANVHRRIVHLFGEAYGIDIDSVLGEGTRVTMRLPGVHGSNRG